MPLAQKAPPAADDTTEERLWWHAFTRPAAPPLPIDRDQATLHFAHAEALRQTAVSRHAVAWQGAGAAALIGGLGGRPPLDAGLRLTFMDPRVPEAGRGLDSLPSADRFAHEVWQQFMLRRDDVIPYGPFLCMAATVVVGFWAGIWNWAQPLFAMGWLVPAVLIVCLVLLGVVLAIWQLLKSALFG